MRGLLAAVGIPGCLGIVLLLLSFGGWAVQLTLFGLFGLSVPFWACALAALIPVIGQICIPIAVILWLVSLAGVALPLFA
jgi:hypothetical protein